MDAGIYLIKCVGLTICLLGSIFIAGLAEEKITIFMSSFCIGMCFMSLIYLWLVEGTWVI